MVARCSKIVLRNRLHSEGVATPDSTRSRSALARTLVETMLLDNLTVDEVVGDNTAANTATVPTATVPAATAAATANTATVPAADPAAPTATETKTALPTSGDCYEVWWEFEEQWYSCVVKSQRQDVDGSTASLCLYDDDVPRWHNLLQEKIRRINPTTDRITKMTTRNIRERLRSEGIAIRTSWRKPKLVSLLVGATTTDATTSPTANTNATVPAADTTASPALPPVRAKHGQSHIQRVVRRKRKAADKDQADSNKRNRTDTRKRKEDQSMVPTRKRKKTAAQVVDGVGLHAQALYTLSTVGTRRDNRQHEREGYNLLVFSQRQMTKWDAQAHVWQAGDSDMTLLHTNISAVYDTTGWQCINTYADGDGVVFLRPPPPLKVRGCGALGRRKNFKWTKDMGGWLHRKTHNLNPKSTPFVALALEAEALWGYAAPQQEHLENRIRGRHNAKKDGRPPPAWVLEASD